MKTTITFLLFLLAAAPARAQLACSDPCTVEQGKPVGFTVEQPSTGQPSGYRLYIDGAVFIDNIVAQAGTTEVFGFTLTALGQHTLQVTAITVDASGAVVAESDKSPEVTFTVTTPTSSSTQPASNVRVIR